MLCDKSSWGETTYREYCIKLAYGCQFTYRSKRTKELYRRTVLDLVLEPGLNIDNFAIGEEQLEKLNAKLFAYFFRLEQQKLTGDDRWGCDHRPDSWNCCSDARLLETLLDPEWRSLIQFAILPCGETLVSGTDQTAASTVWSTVISVLFNNKECYKLKTRFSTDLDFWHFIPQHKHIRKRSADLLKDRLSNLQSHFAKLFKNWKATSDASFCTDLKQKASEYNIDQDTHDDACYSPRPQDDVLNLTALYMFEIWSQNQDDEFINQVFGLADDASDDAESGAGAIS